MIIITAPSGAGKTTLVRHLLATYDEIAFSVSATTRKKRKTEKEAVDYYFLSTKKFKKLIEDDAFAEWEEVYEDQFYGTLKKEVKRIWNEGKHIVFDIDVQGALSLKKRYPKQSMAVFIKPPSKKVLVERLRNRKTDSEEAIKKRIKKASKELKYSNKFDKVLVNDLLEVAKKEVELMVEDFIQT